MVRIEKNGGGITNMCVLECLREVNRREVAAVSGMNDGQLWKALRTAPGYHWIARKEGYGAIAVIGASELRNGVWQAYMLATDDFPKISFSLTRWVLRVMIPLLKSAGAHRIECESIVADATWLKFLGMEREAVLHQRGRNKEDLYLYALKV